METKKKWQYACGAAVMLAVAVLILTVLSLLSVTDKQDIYLSDTREKRLDWRYELLMDDGQVQPYEPVFEGNGVVLSLPEGTRAVRISRTMTEDIPRAELEWMRYDDGVEVAVDGTLLHTDFPLLDRAADGFVHLDREQWEQLIPDENGIWRRFRISLPEDYLGKELSVTTYFPPDGSNTTPEYPFLGNEDSAAATAVVFTVRYNVAMTIYALLTLLMAVVFLLDVHNSNADGSTLLLCLHFLLLFLNTAYGSYEGYYSILTDRLDLRFLRAVYMAPLYLYLAMRMRTRWKWSMCIVILAWATYEGVREFLLLYTNDAVAYSIGPGALVMFLIVAAALCADSVRQNAKRTPQEKKRLSRYGVMTVIVLAVYLFGRVRVWGSLWDYLAEGIWTALRMGNFGPLVTILTDITSYMTVIVVASETIRRTIQTRRTVDVLRDRTRQAMESYEHLLAAENATNALHHEMRHHMTALSAILKTGDIQRAASYADTVAGDLDRLPVGRYSQNVLVNVIAGGYLDRARAKGIRVEHRLNVPQTLPIADEDLSVFLSNMLQNAVEACERIEPGQQERYIKADMRLQGKFLFIRCVNSVGSEPEEREDRPGHGYGLEAMRSVAEKYNSVLVVKRSPGEFSAMSNLCLPER